MDWQKNPLPPWTHISIVPGFSVRRSCHYYPCTHKAHNTPARHLLWSCQWRRPSTSAWLLPLPLPPSWGHAAGPGLVTEQGQGQTCPQLPCGMSWSLQHPMSRPPNLTTGSKSTDQTLICVLMEIHESFTPPPPPPKCPRKYLSAVLYIFLSSQEWPLFQEWPLNWWNFVSGPPNNHHQLQSLLSLSKWFSKVQPWSENRGHKRLLVKAQLCYWAAVWIVTAYGHLLVKAVCVESVSH